MRELTKSVLSFGWVIPLFGMKQMGNLMMPQDPKNPTGSAQHAMDSVVGAARSQLGQTFDSMFSSGDQMQRGMVDMMFGVWSPEAMNPGTWMNKASEWMQCTAPSGAGGGSCGCGAPPSATPPGGQPSDCAGWAPMPNQQP